MIHVRRGDYVKLKHFHHNVPVAYYKKCYDELYLTDENIQYVVFSDDIPYCRKEFNSFLPKDTIYIANEKDYIELHMMKYFDIYVIANSTFSWWGAYNSYSNGDEIVYMPYKWLANGETPKGMVLDKWKIIKY